MINRTLYQADTVCVEYFSESSAKLAFVFSELLNDDLSGNLAEGERLLKDGFDLVVFKIKSQNWLQSIPEALFGDVMDLVSKQKYAKKTGYGIGQGAVDALGLSRLMGLETAMLISPQGAAGDGFSISQTCKYFIFFDNKNEVSSQTQKWLDMIPVGNAKVTQLPYSGRCSSQYLNEIGRLAQLEQSVLNDDACNGIDVACNRGQSIAYLFNLGTALLSRNKLLSGLGVTKKALIINNKIWSLHYRMGEILGKLGRHNEAIHAIRAAIELDERNPHLHYHLSNIFLNAEMLHEALQASSRVVELVSDHPGFLGYHSNLLWRNGRPDESLSVIMLAIELDQNNANYHAHKSGVLDALGRLDDAIQAGKDAAVLDQSNPYFHLHVSSLAAKKGLLDAALQAAGNAISLAPDNQAMLDHYNTLLTRQRSLVPPPTRTTVSLDALLAPWR